MDKAYIGPRSSITTNLATVGVVAGTVGTSTLAFKAADALDDGAKFGAALKGSQPLRYGAAAGLIAADALLLTRITSPDSVGAGIGPGAAVGAGLGASVVGARMLLHPKGVVERATHAKINVPREVVYETIKWAGSIAVVGAAVGMGMSFLNVGNPLAGKDGH